MKLRKTMAAFAAVTVSAAVLCASVSAEDSVSVYVTISDGKLQLAQQKISVTDTDGDGALTINDALYCAHEEKFKGGAKDGYASAETDYGLSMTKLWGIENGGSYGYYVNDASAWSLADPVSEGDSISAFVYTDTAGFSDTYCYFDKKTFTAGTGKKVTLTLSAAAYDENWNPITVPVVGAEITLDGKKTGIFTDENGTVRLTFKEAGNYTISAVSDTQTLVPPVCRAAVAAVDGASAEADGGNPATGVSLCIVAPALCALAALALRKRNA